MRRNLFLIILEISIIFSQTLPIFAQTYNGEGNIINIESISKTNEEFVSLTETNKMGFSEAHNGYIKKENQNNIVSDNTNILINKEYELSEDLRDELSIESAGNSISDATVIPMKTTYSGIITSSNNADYYKFEINSSGRVVLTATAGMNWIYYYLYDSSGNQLWTKCAIWNSTSNMSNISESLDLNKGTYYFVVGQYGSTTGNYSFMLDFSSANESFTETGNENNNALMTANNISLATKYDGQIALNDDKDFYKFTLSSSGRIDMSATAGMYGIYYYIFDSLGNQLWTKCAIWNSTSNMSNISESLDLNEGTYYFAVEQYGHCTGSYTFIIDTHTNNNYLNEQEGDEANTITESQKTYFEKGNLKFKIINAKKKQVMVLRCLNKNSKKIVVPTNIKYNGVTYSVVSIGSNAFSSLKNLEVVTIGRNVITIGKKAFYNCGKIKAFHIKTTKIDKVEKEAFGKLSTKCRVYVEDKMIKKYKKLFYKSGMNKKIRIS